MSLIGIVLAIAIVGFVVWLILQIPMPELFRTVIVAVVCFLLIIWVLGALGVHTGLPELRLK